MNKHVLHLVSHIACKTAERTFDAWLSSPSSQDQVQTVQKHLVAAIDRAMHISAKTAAAIIISAERHHDCSYCEYKTTFMLTLGGNIGLIANALSDISDTVIDLDLLFNNLDSLDDSDFEPYVSTVFAEMKNGLIDGEAPDFSEI